MRHPMSASCERNVGKNKANTNTMLAVYTDNVNDLV